jgi:hypothetical protein
MKILVGSTGLIGVTLQEKIKFDLFFNSKNINELTNYDLNGSDIYLSCLPATKWLVNQNIPKDIDNINLIINYLSNFNFNKIILISTIDVYVDSPLLSDENYSPNLKNLNYGTNRLLFELLVKQKIKYNDLKIFRLPALFNKHIKKNILFDLINGNNVNQINLNSRYQWYFLDDLVGDINYYQINYPNETLFNLFTEPIETTEIVKLFPNYNNENFLIGKNITYDYKTKHYNTGYIETESQILIKIKKFIDESIGK